MRMKRTDLVSKDIDSVLRNSVENPIHRSRKSILLREGEIEPRFIHTNYIAWWDENTRKKYQLEHVQTLQDYCPVILAHKETLRRSPDMKLLFGNIAE